LSESSKISPEIFEQTLCLFIKGLSERKGIDRNIWVKSFIKNILYSKEEIFITLYYKRGLEEEDSLFSDCGCPHPAAVRKNVSTPHKKIPPISTDRGNETQLAPGSELSRTIDIILPNTIHGCKNKNLS